MKKSDLYHIHLMMRAKSNLEGIPQNCPKPEEYDTILTMIKDYIDKNCKHHIVCDSIDISCDESRTIYYCEYCSKTFDKN
jgi:hypothetical protein